MLESCYDVVRATSARKWDSGEKVPHQTLKEMLHSMTNRFCHKGLKNHHKTLFMMFSNNIMYSASQKVSRDIFVKTSQIDTIYDVS